MLRRSRKAPLSQLFTVALRLASSSREYRFEVRTEEFDFSDTAFRQRPDLDIHRIGRAWSARQAAEAVGDRSQPHAADYRIDLRKPWQCRGHLDEVSPLHVLLLG